MQFDTLNIFCIFYIFTIFCISVLIFVTESLLNIMEDYRAKPSSWYAVGWMPIVDEEKSLRTGSGYDSAAASNMRIHQECWRHFLKRYITDAEDARIIFYGDGKARQTRHSIGAVLGDQQVYVSYFAWTPDLYDTDAIMSVPCGRRLLLASRLAHTQRSGHKHIGNNAKLGTFL